MAQFWKNKIQTWFHSHKSKWVTKMMLIIVAYARGVKDITDGYGGTTIPCHYYHIQAFSSPAQFTYACKDGIYADWNVARISCGCV